MIAEYHFKLPNGHGITHIESILADRYAFVVAESVVKRWAFYDTFDWRLFDEEMTLQQSEGKLILCSLADGEVLHKVDKPAPAKFAATFTRFASPANQKEYRQLFASKGKRGKA